MSYGVARVDRDSASNQLIIRGSPDVVVEDRPAAFAYDSINAAGVAVIQGASTVFINDKPIARESDLMADGMPIANGSNTVKAEEK